MGHPSHSHASWQQLTCGAAALAGAMMTWQSCLRYELMMMELQPCKLVSYFVLCA
jgi:hypothetical protein